MNIPHEAFEHAIWSLESDVKVCKIFEEYERGQGDDAEVEKQRKQGIAARRACRQLKKFYKSLLTNQPPRA